MRRRTGAGLVLGVAAAACATSSTGPPPPAETFARCATARAVDRDEVGARRITIRNGIGESVRIVLDLCVGHQALGELDPGETAAFPLPPHLFEFPQGLRLHAYTVDPEERFGSFAMELGSIRDTLRLTGETRMDEAAAPSGPTGMATREWYEAVSVFVGEEEARASVFSFGTGAVLSWRCLRGTPSLWVSAARPVTGDPVVTVRFTGGASRTFGTWSLVRGMADGASAPDSVISTFTRHALGTTSLKLSLSTEEDVPQGHVFNLGGLADALVHLGCLP